MSCTLESSFAIEQESLGPLGLKSPRSQNKRALQVKNSKPCKAMSKNEAYIIRPALIRETKDTVRGVQEYLFTGSSKATSCGFWQKRVRLSDLLEGGLTALQEPTFTVLLALPNLVGEWIGGVWNGRFSESEKYFSEAEFWRKIHRIPQQEQFLPNFRLRNVKFQSPKNAIPYPQPFHTPTRLPPNH